MGKGTGLGLATIYGIVKQHEGWISVKSEVGRGTRFQIFLPAAEGRLVANANCEAPSPGPLGHEGVLVVEDEESLRTLVATILQRHGYRVWVAADGIEAWELWQKHRSEIDLVLTDMVMPKGLNGRDLALQVQGEKPSIKVIFTSGYNAELLKEGATLHEGINFLQKPYTCDRLLHMVRFCLGPAGI